MNCTFTTFWFLQGVVTPHACCLLLNAIIIHFSPANTPAAQKINPACLDRNRAKATNDAVSYGDCGGHDKPGHLADVSYGSLTSKPEGKTEPKAFYPVALLLGIIIFRLAGMVQ